MAHSGVTLSQEPSSYTGNILINSLKVSYCWNINNFSLLTGKVYSPRFSPPGRDDIKFHIEANFNEQNRFTFCLSCRLLLTSCSSGSLTGRYRIYTLNAQNPQLTNTEEFPINSPPQDILIIYGYELRNKADRLAENYNIKLFCDMTITTSPSDQSTTVHLNDLGLTFSKSFGEVLESQDFSDVTLKVDGRDIPAHKVILAARSPVFAAMFRHKMQEQSNNCVHITDTSYEALLELMRYVYTGTAPNLGNMARDLLMLSDKYALDDLKKLCENNLSETVALDVVVELLILADMHSAQELKNKAKQFIVINANKVVKTPAFKTLISKEELALEIWTALSEKSQNSNQSNASSFLDKYVHDFSHK